MLSSVLLERKYDAKFRVVFDAIHKLTASPQAALTHRVSVSRRPHGAGQPMRFVSSTTSS